MNPNDSFDRNAKTVDKNARYTNLEMYLNSLVHDIMVAGSSGGTIVR
ncbi:hypothetical protein [uncultured Bacteroides sp.]|nr:hypothetical protein [uncultured Bacteroides sp.]